MSGKGRKMYYQNWFFFKLNLNVIFSQETKKMGIAREVSKMRAKMSKLEAMAKNIIDDAINL